MTRTLRIALRFSWAAPGRTLLLALLVAVSMSVFLVVTELSRVSAAGLDDAIVEDAGRTGQYFVEVSPSVGLSSADLAATVSEAVAPFVTAPVEVVDVLPPVASECPPYDVLGEQQFLVLRTAALEPVALPFGAGQPVDTRFCFGGQEVPSAAVYVPAAGDQRRWGLGLFTTASFEHVVALNSVAPVVTRFVVVTGARGDQLLALEDAVTQALGAAALRNGVDIVGAVSVVRVDSGEGLRSASIGIRSVYAAIGWGVLALGGLGLLVAQLIVVRQRMWFFGLTRALGARAGHVVVLIAADVLVVVLLGTGLALGGMGLLQPVTSSFTEQAFGLPTQVVNLQSTLLVLVSNLVLVAVAAGAPALSAVRNDPLDVLEHRHE